MAASRSTTTTPQESPQPRRNAPAIIVGLLAVSVFVNYIDRGNLSTAAPMLKNELGLSGTQLGVLLSAFFWSYGLFQVLSGWLVDRINVGWVMAVGFFIWSAATSVAGMLHSFGALVVARIFLGIGESVAYPAYSKTISTYIPENRRGSTNALIAAGLSCGPAFGMLLGGTLMSRFGWRPFLVGTGLISLVWLVPWLRWMPRGRGLDSLVRETRSPGMLGILKQRSAWGCFLGQFCSGYTLYLLISWLPFYLVHERHFPLVSMARIGGAVFLAQALSAIACGRIADRWIAAGRSPTRVHKSFLIAGMLGMGTFLVASALASPSACTWFLLLAGISFGMSMSNLWPTTQRLAGPLAAGRWTGLQCAFGNCSGAVSSALTGIILDRAGHFLGAFVVAAGFNCVGAVTWIFIVGRIEPVQWAANRPCPKNTQAIAAETA
jgi:MFS family permease